MSESAGLLFGRTQKVVGESLGTLRADARQPMEGLDQAGNGNRGRSGAVRWRSPFVHEPTTILSLSREIDPELPCQPG